MAHRKAGGTAKNLRDSNPKYLGVKLANGATAKPGSIIIRQRGTVYLPGVNVRVGKDHTLFSISAGKVVFGRRRKIGFDGQTKKMSVVSVVPA